MRITAIFAALVTLSAPAAAAVIGASVPAQPLTEERIAQLPAAQRGPWREYLARSVKQERIDRAFLEAEMKAAGLTEAIVPPNGSAARSMPLNRPAEWYASAEARRITAIIVSFQTPAGGWSKNINLADHARKPGENFAPNN